MQRLKNKIALITGAGRGIGKETARLFAKEGAHVIVSDVDDDAGQKVVDELGKQAEYMHLDVSKEESWQSILETIKEKHGKLDILFNNAGIIGFGESFGPQDPEHASLQSWHEVHAVNLDGVFLGCKYGMQLMKKHGGSIINMSSRSGIVGIPGAAAYASSKAAIRNHTKTVALYCAQEGYKIRCNSLHPAAIITPMWDPMFGNTEEQKAAVMKAIEAGIPMGKMGKPLDVAYAALYLASDESAYLTGIELTIDGGILAGASSAPAKKD